MTKTIEIAMKVEGVETRIRCLVRGELEAAATEREMTLRLYSMIDRFRAFETGEAQP